MDFFLYRWKAVSPFSSKLMKSVGLRPAIGICLLTNEDLHRYDLVRILTSLGCMNVTERNSEWKWQDGPIGRLMKMGYITLRKDVEEMLKPLGLTHTQWSALRIIRQFPGITSSQIEPILMIERPSVTSLMNGLEKKGLIVRKDHPEDGRFKLIYLTDEGVRTADETERFAADVENKVKAGLTPEEFDSLKKLLVKMVGIFEKR